MKITGVEVNILKAERLEDKRQRNCPNGIPRMPETLGLARISTDTGIEGYYEIEGREAVATQFIDFVKRYLIGTDPFDKEKLLDRFTPVLRRGGERFPFYGWSMRIIDTRNVVYGI